MALQFPTMAQQAVAAFETRKVKSLATIAKRMGADHDRKWDRIEYTFDDDTTLIVQGRGRAHRYWTELP